MTSLPPSPEPTQNASPYRWLIVVLGVVLLIVVLYRSINLGAPAISTTALRKISVIPPFALTERSGRTVTNQDLSGKIWVADFVYTTCPGPCPLITAGMAKIQQTVANDPQVQLVTFTVDPTTDTPAVLTKYADSFGADPNRWWFLTGTEKQIYDLMMNGFHVAVQNNSDQPPEPGQFKVTHSTYLVLVDGDGDMRQVYDGVSGESRASLLHDIKLLEKEQVP
jgi:protein SCO1/2